MTVLYPPLLALSALMKGSQLARASASTSVMVSGLVLASQLARASACTSVMVSGLVSAEPMGSMMASQLARASACTLVTLRVHTSGPVSALLKVLGSAET